jgi:4-hydroxy-2-oxoheptanedioate aldolase
MGLMYFDVDSRDQVEQFSRFMHYPPAGTRQNSGGSAFDYQLTPSTEDAYRFVNENTMLVIQLESAEAIENLDDILEGGPVDVVEIGRSDLSASLGVPGQRRHPRVLEAVDKAIAACRRLNVTPGCGADSAEDAEDMIGRGMRYVFYPTNDLSLLKRSYKEAYEHLSSLTPDRTTPAPA